MPAGVVLVFGLAVAGVAAAGCTSAPTPASPSPATTAESSPGPSADRRQPRALTARDWPTYHRDATRTGVAPAQPAAGPMAIAWRRQLDGAVYGQPLAIGNLVIAATEGDTVYGLDRGTGQVRWRAHLGTPVPLSSLPCGNIDPLGITGTPVYDPATGLVYAVAETTGFHHVLAGIDISTGRVAFRRDIPTPDGQPRYDQQRAALTAERGRVYVAFGGLFGDCGPYRGSIVGVPASGHGPLVSYTVPTAQRGGIWAPGGPVIAPDGTMYVSVGNGAATSPPFDGSDSVTALTPRLQRVGIFAPATWAADNASDLDLGSASPAWLAGGKILAAGKRGTAYLLNARRLPGLGAPLAQTGVCDAFGGMAARGAVAYVPCASGGMAAVDTAGDRIRVLWRGPASAQGSPVIGGGVVWVADWNSGLLYQLDPATGRVLRQISVGVELPHFASPSLSGRLALVGTMSGVVAVSGA
ncbi:MAG TPA: PQQ-binding-like beta-propeller repeat protein [Streptosporangiaceae bacterium]